MADKQPPERQIRPFATTLQEINNGKAHTRLSDQLHTLVAAVAETGKKGELTIKVIVAPLKKGQTNTLVTTVSSTLKAPEGDDAAPSSVFFVDRAGNLTRNDPQQMQLPLRVVPDGEAAAQ